MRRIPLSQAVSLSELVQAQNRLAEAERENVALRERVELLERVLGKAAAAAHAQQHAAAPSIVMPKDRATW